MSILFVLILNMIFVSRVRSGSFASVMCAFAGNSVYDGVINNYKLNVADIPASCEAVIYGEHYMNGPPIKADAPALQALVAAGKSVYMIYKVPDKVDWEATIKDPAKLDTFIAPMMSYVNENKISGVILGYLGIFNGVIKNYATYINTLITKVKQCAPSIKVGLYIQANNVAKFSDANIFDISKVDANVDFYDIDMWFAGSGCKPNYLESGGRLPKSSTDKDVISLSTVYNAVKNSHMDQSKLVVALFDIVTVAQANGVFGVRTYSEFCKGGKRGSDLWCGDSIKILYGEVTYLKGIFKGLLINYLDYDDSDNSCGCGKFVIANTYIDSLKGNPMKDCPKIC